MSADTTDIKNEKLDLTNVDYDDVLHLYRGWRKSENALRSKNKGTITSIINNINTNIITIDINNTNTYTNIIIIIIIINVIIIIITIKN